MPPTPPACHAIQKMSFSVLQKCLADQPDIKLALVFGSVARGTARRDSDLDIAVQTSRHRPLTAERRIALIENLALASGRPVDLIDLDQTGVPLLGEILRNGQLVAGSRSDLAELALRNIYLNEDFLPLVRDALAARNRRWLQ
jgi:predicted nucleotidyltransferase